MLGTRNYPVVIAAGVAVLLFSLVGGAAMTGVLPQDLAAHNPLASPLLETTAAAAAAKKGDCRACGIVTSIRAVEVRSDASAGASAAKPPAAAGQKVYRVTVRMDDGSERALSQSQAPLFPVGARVRVSGNSISRG